MFVSDAKRIARDWVHKHLEATPGFAGAFFHGSIHSMPDNAVLPSTSDIDIMIVCSQESQTRKPGKFIYRGVMLEVSYLAESEFAAPEKVLSTYHLAPSFRYPGIILDPTGQLNELQTIVGREFALEMWVRARCDDARARLLRNLQNIEPAETFHDAVTSWLFAGGVATHILLVAGFRNPTVRKRYLEVQELLGEYGHPGFYGRLLELIGAESIDRRRVQRHLDNLSDAFDAAAGIIKSPFFFAADITPAAKTVAIAGSQEMVDSGHHREAIFWIVATYARCIAVFTEDGTQEQQGRFEPGFHELLADLGVRSRDDLLVGRHRIELLLSAIDELAEEIIRVNPEVKHDELGDVIVHGD